MKIFGIASLLLGCILLILFIGFLSGHGPTFIGAAILPLTLVTGLFFLVLGIRIIVKERSRRRN